MADRRKLPPWPELRRLLLVERVTLAELQERYGVTEIHKVRHTVERDARAHGDWPLPAYVRLYFLQKLPDHETLRRHVVEDGWDHYDIGRHYGCRNFGRIRIILNAELGLDVPPRPPGAQKGVNRKLPPYETLKRLVEEGRPLHEIAKTYRMSSAAAVLNTLRREAEERGEWPLTVRAHTWDHHDAAKKRMMSVGHRNTLLAMWLREYVAPARPCHGSDGIPYGITAFARLAGVSTTVVWKMYHSRSEFVLAATAKKIEAALARLEGGLDDSQMSA